LEIEEQGIPCVFICDRIDSPAISWVDGDNEKAAVDSVERLCALGHRSFAFLGRDPKQDYNPNIRERERAVRSGLKKKAYRRYPSSLPPPAPASLPRANTGN
jgi:Transcriptional regulators